jgi:ribonuclease R
MRSKIGALLEGTVTGFSGTGVFVAIDDPFVDVLIRMEALGPDQYALDDDGLRVVGARSGDRIALGDRLLVEIEDVAILRRQVYGRRVVRSSEDDGSAGGPRKERRATKRSGHTLKGSGHTLKGSGVIKKASAKGPKKAGKKGPKKAGKKGPRR